MASPAFGAPQSSSPNPFDAYARSLGGEDQADRLFDTHGHAHAHPPRGSASPPPTATNGDAVVHRHHLEAAIPESPAEESRANAAEDRQVPVPRPPPSRQGSVLKSSPLAGASSSSSSRARISSSGGGMAPAEPSTSGPTAVESVHHPKPQSAHGSETQHPAPTVKPKKEKHGLMRKLSGLNFLHHHHDKSSLSSSSSSAALSPTSGQLNRKNVESAGAHPLKSPTTNNKNDDSAAGSPTSASGRPNFTVGGEESALPSPRDSRMHSRAPSSDNLPILPQQQQHGYGGQRAPSAASSVASQRQYDDFQASAPKRSNSTFNFFRKGSGSGTNAAHDVALDTASPPQRSSSFSHGDPHPVPVPGSQDHPDIAMDKLARTLSKSSLAGGHGWGSVTEKLPTFDSLYTYRDANEKKIKLDLSTKSGQIGEGAGGVIRTARLKDRCHPAYHPGSRGGDLGLFAVKTFRKQSDRESEGWYCQKLVREFRIHSALTHDNIVKLADICVEQKRYGDPQFVAVLDFCVGGDLFDLHYHQWNSIDQGVMSKVERLCVFKQLMFAVNYMHDLGIAHRDIKLENMLVNGHGQLKLADFGTSVFTTGVDAEDCRGFVGTDHSVAPEAYLSALSPSRPAYDGLKADIWACAVAWHILTWSNDEPLAALRAYPFGPEGADPDNKAWQKYMNSIKRYEPNKYIPGWDLYMERKTEKNSSPPPTPVVHRQGSMAFSAHSGQSGRSELDMMFDTSDPTPYAATMPADDLRDPLRKCRPFANGYPGSGFTVAKGMLDPDPATRWSARRVLDDPFFSLIECCQRDSYANGYDASRERARKGLQKVHNHIRSSARKLMEVSKVEQQRNQELVDSKRSAR